MIKELDGVVLLFDLPGLELKAGDVGTVVMIHEAGAAYEVEFMALDVETLAVTTFEADRVRPIDREEIARPAFGGSDLAT